MTMPIDIRRPSATRSDSVSVYSQSLAEYHKAAGSKTPSPTEDPLLERGRSFQVKRASSYRVPVPPYDRPEAPTPTRATRSASVTEFPPIEAPSRARALYATVLRALCLGSRDGE